MLVYEGERFVVPEGKDPGTSGTASAVCVVDWDADGDLDLLVGDIAGRVALVRNAGTAKDRAFSKPVPLQAGGADLKVDGDAGPCVADWDGDGLPDLLVGDGQGKVSLFRGAGSRTALSLESARILIPKSEVAYGKPPKVPTRGQRAKVCVADWNGDGRLDLLLGDITYQKPDLPEPTPEQKAEHDRLRAERKQVSNRWEELYTRQAELRRAGDKDELAKIEKEVQAVRDRMREIDRLLPVESENHGFVWLFARRSAQSAAAK
ncbi:MAG TPA: FG-GAP-like repeat-containing protein [Planctomycetota bacterium]|nr:FG-GAP-like repeat-containing protein [Planctomycetota bacterium]